MHLFAIAILIGTPVLTSAGFSQRNSSFTTPTSASQPADSAADSQAPSSGPLGSGPAPSTGLRVCGETKASDCTKAPRIIKSVEPEYSKEAKEKKIEGTVVLMLIVGTDGLPRDIRVTRSLGHGLDEKAIQAVKKWKFKPATLHGHPFAVLINVEAKFQLH
jgi:TonB family protein